MTLEYQDVEISDIVKDLKNLFNPVFQEKKLQFNVQIDSELNNTIETDRLRVDQVLRNLLSNALKFTTQGSINLNIKKTIRRKTLLFFCKRYGNRYCRRQAENYLRSIPAGRWFHKKKIWRYRSRFVHQQRNCKAFRW